MIVSRDSADHYTWGGNCDGWCLVQGENLLIIEERMPAGSVEVRHYHVHAHQFFYVLSGKLTMEEDGQIHQVPPHHGIEIAPGTRHQARNDTNDEVVFLVISSPTTRGDRHETMDGGTW